MKRVVLFSLLSAFAAHAAIKKVEGYLPSPKDAPEAPAQPSLPPQAPGGNWLDDLRKRAPKGGQLEMNGVELERLLRELLESQGVPADELKDQRLPDLLRKLQEKNPHGIPGLRLDGLEKLGDILGFGRDTKLMEKLNEHFKGLLEGQKPGAAKSAPATVAFRDAAKQWSSKNSRPLASDPADAKMDFEILALGAAVRADGWVLTKASEVKRAKDLQCLVKGEWVAAKVARTWEEHDLALVKVSAKDLPIISWTKEKMPDPGTFISAVAPEGIDPVAIGVVSVAERSLIPGGFMGVQLKWTNENGLRITMVIPKSAASNAGILANDRILEVNGEKPESNFMVTRLVGNRKPGEKVKVKVQRGAEVIEKQIELGKRPAMGIGGFDPTNLMSGPLSERRSNFPDVVQTDLPLEATECGGPVADLDGNALGLVIARSGRVETLFLPAAIIQNKLAEVDFAKEAAAIAK